jgi:cytidylate kinase
LTGTLVVAVDGPAASGKSTLARRLAGHLGLPFLDTGLLYRAVGRRLLAAGADPGDVAAAAAAAAALSLADVEHPGLRDEAVGQAASRVAAYPAVRAALLPFQRRFAARPSGAVLAGRDVGTIVCPDAAAKIFITASVEERARRRFEELRRGGAAATYSAVLEELRQRDHRDESRAVAPLRAAADAWVLDTTDLDADAAFEAARRHLERSCRGRGPSGSS